MAKIIQCDRCGKQVTTATKRGDWGVMSVESDDQEYQATIDICPGCLRTAREFMKRLPEPAQLKLD